MNSDQLQDVSFVKKNFRLLYDAKFHQQKKMNPHTRHHIESFNNFVNNDLQTIINQYNPITIVSEKGTIKIRAVTEITDVQVLKPYCMQLNKEKAPIYPNECSMVDTSYLMNIYAHYTFKLYRRIGTGPEKLQIQIDSMKDNLEPILIGKIPVMIKSDYCSLAGLTPDQLETIKEDPREIGGYFKVMGNEYCIIFQENKAENFIYKNIDVKNKIIEYSTWIQSKITNKYDYPYFTIVKMTKGQSNKEDLIWINVNVSKKNESTAIPLNIVFRALGVATDEEIAKLICYKVDPEIDELIEARLEPSLRYVKPGTEKIRTQKEALIYIGKIIKPIHPTKEETEQMLIERASYEYIDKMLFPHIGGASEIKKKVLFLAYMVRTTINLSFGIEHPLDRDNYGNKRILTSGVLYGQLFKHFYQNQVLDYKKNGQKDIQNYSTTKDYSGFVSRWFNDKKMSGMIRHINTGIWPAGSAKGHQKKEGVSQTLERKGTMDTIMFLNRVATPTSKKSGGQNLGIHKLHQTHWGYIDPFDTPDSDKIGIIKHLTPFTEITQYSSPENIYDILLKQETIVGAYPITSILPDEFGKMARIFINGDLAYITPKEEINIIANKLRELRRNGDINRFTSIIVNHKLMNIDIRTEAGRIMRPLFIVNKGNKLRMTEEIFKGLETGKYNWNYLIVNAIIEYLDIHECMENCMIAYNMKSLKNGKNELINYTHMEFDESVILDYNSLSIPFAPHNQGPRNTFQDGMKKQSVGTYSLNYRSRMDKSALILQYSEKPLISTLGDKYTGMEETPAGINLFIAITTYAGFNQEDAIICNKRTSKNGAFDVINYKVISDSIVGGGSEDYMKPDKELTRNYKIHNNYSILDEQGLPIIGSIVRKDDVIIGKVRHLTRSEREQLKTHHMYTDKSIIYQENMPGTIEKVYIINNEEGNKIIKIKVRVYRELVIGDKFSCYDDETEVLTDEGWKYFKDINITDQIASYEPENEELKYVCPEEIFSYKVEDTMMYSFQSLDVSLLVTGNHKMYTRSLTEKDYCLKRADKVYGASYHKKKIGTFKGKSITDVEILKEYVMNIIKTDDIPDHLLKLRKDDVKFVVDTLIKKYKSRKIYSTKRVPLFLDKLQILCIHAGYTASINKKNNYIVIDDDPLDNYIMGGPILQKYNGNVYCCQVPSGILMVRRKGKHVLCGNSRQAQKGTCSILMNKEDMPFTEDGLVPDIIFNPHGFVTRMTTAYIIELLTGIIAAHKATTIDGTPFNGISLNKDIIPQLQELGFTDLGDRTMFDGITGERMRVKIFGGFGYYQRLKHMVNDKIYARAQGPRVRKTKQPIHGRASGGALKLGYMEKDALLSHGASLVLKEAFYDNSDHFQAYYSEKTGLVCEGNEKERYFRDKGGKNYQKISKVKIPWTSIMHDYYLQTLGIAARKKLDEDEL